MNDWLHESVTPEEARTVECPYCHAAAGEPCRNNSTYRYFRDNVTHLSRKGAYRDAQVQADPVLQAAQAVRRAAAGAEFPAVARILQDLAEQLEEDR